MPKLTPAQVGKRFMGGESLWDIAMDCYGSVLTALSRKPNYQERLRQTDELSNLLRAYLIRRERRGK